MNALETAAADIWRFYPHTYAIKASGRRWKAYPHIRHLCDRLMPGLVAGGGRYIVTMPPRHGKSEFISNWLPTWYLDCFPDRKVILTSYAAKFAAKWGRKVRTNLESFDHATVKVRQDSRAADRFDTTAGGQMITAGVGGPITGEGAHLAVIDDPVKNWVEAMSETRRQTVKDWFDSTLYTRLEPKATIILLMTRWHEDDLAGYLLNEHEDDWELINLPAIAEDKDSLGRRPGEALCPDRYDAPTLEKIMRAVGSRVADALYQQRPVAAEGESWKRSYWRFWKQLPEKFDEMIQSWDLTFKDKAQSKSGDVDYVVGQVWGRLGANLYLVDQVRGQWGFNKTKDEILKLTIKYPHARRKMIEDKANGAAVQDNLRNTISGIVMVEPKGGKLARATAAEPAIESGNVYLPDQTTNPWVKDFINEAAAFPKGKHDDQVDAASQAILTLDNSSRSVLYKLIRT
jgi:predicted phage terminase large subunit-like protein